MCLRFNRDPIFLGECFANFIKRSLWGPNLGSSENTSSNLDEASDLFSSLSDNLLYEVDES